MTINWAIWTSVALLAAALAWMGGLVLARLLRDREASRRAAERSALIEVLVRLLLTDDAQLQLRLARYVPQARLMAEVVLELQVVVRGAEQERLLQRLRDLGLARVFIVELGGRRRLRRLYAEALAALGGPEASRALAAAALDDRDPDSRITALRYAAQTGSGAGVDQLLDDALAGRLRPSRLLADLFRQAAIADLPAAVQAVQRPDLTPLLKAMLLDALAGSGDYAVIAALMEATVEPQVEIRAAAVRGLGRLMHPDAAPAIAAALDDPEWLVRTVAAEAAGRARLAALAPKLARLLDDPEWWVRLRAGEALAALGASAPQLSAA